MNDIFLGSPSFKQELFIKSRNGLAIACTNGKIIRFSKEELQSLGTAALGICGYYTSTITNQLFKDKIIEATGTDSSDVITHVIDDSHVFDTIGNSCFMLCKNLIYVNMPYIEKLTSGYQFYGTKLKSAKGVRNLVSGVGIHAFSESLLEEFDFGKILNIGYCYNMFTDCKKLMHVDASKVIRIVENCSSMFAGCENLHYISFDNLICFDLGGASHNIEFLRNSSITHIDFPKMTTCEIPVFTNGNVLQHIGLQSMTKDFISQKNYFGAKSGTEIEAKDQTFVVP